MCCATITLVGCRAVTVARVSFIAVALLYYSNEIAGVFIGQQEIRSCEVTNNLVGCAVVTVERVLLREYSEKSLFWSHRGTFYFLACAALQRVQVGGIRSFIKHDRRNLPPEQPATIIAPTPATTIPPQPPSHRHNHHLTATTTISPR